MKRISQFRFKHFSVWHHRSALKVGVDGVLVGCWAEASGAHRILDVGSGCGLIALIMAQRYPETSVTGVDIDGPSVEEANENVMASPWSDRIGIMMGSFPEVLHSDDQISQSHFDFVVSNPPYYDSGVTDAVTAREKARHQGHLSPSSLLSDSLSILNPGGGIAIIVPSEFAGALETEADILGYVLTRKCLVRGHKDAPYKRTLLQWRKGSQNRAAVVTTYLTLETSPGIPSEEYRKLCKGFYLKF